jgi:energy-coupling factor transporter ATP-binding protein EcfA2
MTERESIHSFEAYNARWLTASQVASTFVPPYQFGDLAKHRHTVLVGPRGSGKTTLLKMLQPAAIERWTSTEADWYRDNIDYTGVFIPADISWRLQLDSTNSRIKDENQRILLSNAAFATHILQAIIETMYYRVSQAPDEIVTPFKRCVIDKKEEAIIVNEIAKVFKTTPSIPTFLSLKHSINARLSEIKSITNKTAHTKEGYSLTDFSEYPFLFIDPLSAAGLAIEVFDDICGEQYSKWALLFDELEIAPESIQNELMQALRSTNPKFLFKLAQAPLTSCSKNTSPGTSPSTGNDYDEIQLWYAQKEQKGASERKKKFCMDLWNSMVDNRGYSARSTDVFGEGFSEQDSDRKNKENPYGPNGRWGMRFIRLYQIDPTFKEFLDQRNIAPDKILELSQGVRASVIRKAAPIVAVREFYIRPVQSGDKNISLRSRKNISLYTGADSLFDISEGHPRWLKVVMGRLLDRATITNNTLRVKPSVQSEELFASAQRFAALLKTYPVAESNVPKSHQGLLSLIDVIAEYFKNQVVKIPFTPEPYLSFIVDSHVTETLHSSLAQALNLGAIVYVPDREGEVLLTSLLGKRFRISYWLAPLYGLPLILGKPVSLSTILAEKYSQQVKSDNPKNLELPFNMED